MIDLTGEFDARVWAKEFKTLHPEIDEELMLGWFANAIMAGYDHARNTSTSFEDLQTESYECSKASGWHDEGLDESPAIKIVLMHSELSEALEAWREGNPDLYYSDENRPIPKPEGLASELADTVIRIMDLAGQRKINLAKVIKEKQAYNRTRSYRHGGKKI